MELSEFSEFGIWGFGLRLEGFDYRIQALESKANKSKIFKLYYGKLGV